VHYQTSITSALQSNVKWLKSLLYAPLPPISSFYSRSLSQHTVPEPSDFIFNTFNQPFAPADRRTAEELLQSDGDYVHDKLGKDTPAGLASIRKTLLKSWVDIDTVTRR